MTDTQPRPGPGQGPTLEPDGSTGEGRRSLLGARSGRADPGLRGWLRWAWRILTSMRTALVLLALLALAAVPGSLLPQRGVSSDPNAVVGFLREHPGVGPWLDRLGFFEVYSSPWFAAVYLLLLVSMTGCVLPRCRRLWRAARAEPPRAPGRLGRIPGSRRWNTEMAPAEVVADAAARLRSIGFRVRVDEDGVRAEKGYLREAGNLLFHLSLLVLLVGVATGKLFGFEGRAIVVEGSGFSNSRVQYDEFTPGPLLDESVLTLFSFTLDSFRATFESGQAQRGAPRDFAADVTVDVGSGGGGTRTTTIEVNRPLDVDGTKVFLTGNGYAPRVTVRDGRGEMVFSGPVVFLPRDGNLTSTGVVKVPDARPVQLGFEGFFLPTAAFDPETGPFSSFPAALDPRLVLTAYLGDLGLSDGAPQSVYQLDKDALTQVRVDGRPLARALRPGETMTLPGGQGTLTFDTVTQFANFQIARDPGKEVSLVAVVLLLTGLTASLLIRQRRTWVRVWPRPDGSSTIEVATFALTRRGAPDGELDRLADRLGAPVPSVGSLADAGRTEEPAPQSAQRG